MKEIFKIFVLLVMICTFTACAAGGKTSDTKDISIKLESFSDVKKDILSTDTEYENISVPTETLRPRQIISHPTQRTPNRLN